MITNRYDGVVLGSSALQTSVANAEIIPTGKTIINFKLMNDQVCTISINGATAVYVRANQGMEIPVVTSCKIVENNITFNWIGISG
jgi:hypothetical protein